MYDGWFSFFFRLVCGLFKVAFGLIEDGEVNDQGIKRTQGPRGPRDERTREPKDQGNLKFSFCHNSFSMILDFFLVSSRQ